MPEQVNSFPIEIFPNLIQDYIISAYECLNFPIEYIGAGILFTTSLLIGNTLKLKMKNGWYESPILYLAIVGQPGMNKSHSISFALKPIHEKENFYFKEYQEELKRYNLLNDEERKSQTEPIQKQLLIQDITPETINQVHNNNPRGIGYCRDELISWLYDFNRYHKGSDEQFWLSVFSNIPIRINRINRPMLYIRSPYIPVVGSVQPEVLTEIFSNKRRFNGFVDRILFVFPDQLVKPYWKEGEIPDELIKQYVDVMNNFFEIPLKINESGNIIFREIIFQKEARIIFTKWFNKNVDEYNRYKDSHLAGAISKLDIICGRLCLVLQALEDMCNNRTTLKIEIQAVQRATQLVEYFRKQAEKVYTYVSSNQKSVLSDLQLEFYHKLPKEFDRSQADSIAELLRIKLKTAEKYLERFLKLGFLRKPMFNKYQKTNT